MGGMSTVLPTAGDILSPGGFACWSRPVEAYTEWMKGLLTPMADGRYEVHPFCVDEDRNNVTAYAIFRGSHTDDGEPVPPTGKEVKADYA